jgi:hypothetical protein
MTSSPFAQRSSPRPCSIKAEPSPAMRVWPCLSLMVLDEKAVRLASRPSLADSAGGREEISPDEHACRFATVWRCC